MLGLTRTKTHRRAIAEDHDGTVSAWHDYPAGEQPIST